MIMHRILALWVIALTLTAAEPIRHRFVATDESRKQLLLVDERDPSRDWTVPLPGNRDVLVVDQTVVASIPTGWRECSLTDGRTLREVAIGQGISSIARGRDGTFIVGSPTTVWQVAADGRVLRTQAIRGGPYFRVVRPTPGGGILFTCGSTEVVELGADGVECRRFDVKALDAHAAKAYGAVRTADGGTLISSGYGGSLIAVDAAGAVVRRYGSSDPALAHPLYFCSDFTPLPDGGVMLCNWTGHGAQDSTKGPQLVQFDREGRIVWTWHDARRAGTLHGLALLE